MTSPFDALGAAAAILQLVEFGVKLAARAVNIYTSGKGKTREAQEAETEMKTLQRMSNELVARYDPAAGTQVAIDEKDIANTARKCNEIASALLRELDDLIVKGPKNPLKALLGSIKVEVRQSRIEGLQRQLEKQRSILREQILYLLSNQTTFMAREIRKLDQVSNDLRTFQQQVLDALDRQNDRQLETRLRRLQEEGDNVLFRRDILISLRYEGLGLRYGQINLPANGTYQWVFGDLRSGTHPAVRFADWLEQDNGIYFITGRAGSGKSTIMKHIYHDPRTEQALQRWAKGRLLVKSSHFFWYTGLKMQRSYGGLLQSILYEVLCAAPGLVDIVCASRRGNREVRAMPWTVSDLRECVEQLARPDLTVDGHKMCFCLFVDGLDEYEGDDDQVIHILHQFACSQHTKICAASRPWPKFKLSFAESIARGDSLNLHEFTKDDVRKVVDQGLDGHAAVQRNEETLIILKNEIVNKAKGVFLWVALVIKQLTRGLEYADDADTLRDRLRQIPSELKDYFGVIFGRIDPIYKRQTPRLLLTCMRAFEPLPLQAFDLVTNENPGPLKRLFSATVKTSCCRMTLEDVNKYRAKVSGRCQDLLEVEAQMPGDFCVEASQYCLQFLHPSVQDYFGSPEMLQKLTELAGTDFNPLDAIVAAYIFLIKNSTASLREILPAIVFRWSDNALEHAAYMTDVEARLSLIQELDKAMSTVCTGRYHWTNEHPRLLAAHIAAQEPWQVDEQNGRDLIGHLIDLGLSEQAWTLLTREPSLLKHKSGRPYIDYVLRHGWIRSRTKTVIRRHVELAKQLLRLGSDPNEVYMHRTVWERYIIYLFEECPNLYYLYGETAEFDEVLVFVRDTIWSLIDHGAKAFTVEMPVRRNRNTASSQGTKMVTMKELLKAVVGEQEAEAMAEAVAHNTSQGWGKLLKGMVGLKS